MITYRKFNFNEDYSVLKEFFHHYWGEENAPTPDRLPSDGVVADDDQLGVVGCVFLYTTSNSGMAILGFPVLNPKLSKDRGIVIRKMIEMAEFIARYNGYVYMNTWSGTDSIKKHLEESNYKVADSGVSHYIKRL